MMKATKSLPRKKGMGEGKGGKFTGRDANEYAQEKINGMMLLHPDIQEDADDEILDDDAIADERRARRARYGLAPALTTRYPAQSSLEKLNGQTSPPYESWKK